MSDLFAVVPGVGVAKGESEDSKDVIEEEGERAGGAEGDFGGDGAGKRAGGGEGDVGGDGLIVLTLKLTELFASEPSSLLLPAESENFVLATETTPLVVLLSIGMKVAV